VTADGLGDAREEGSGVHVLRLRRGCSPREYDHAPP
jgi:hypothetical protein